MYASVHTRRNILVCACKLLCVLVCRDAVQPMVDVHHSLVQAVSTMAANLYTKHGVRVAEDRHLQGNYAVRKQDEDALKPEFSSHIVEQDMAELIEEMHRSDALLRSSLEAHIQGFLDYMAQKEWTELDGESRLLLVPLGHST
jgi:hypothetical protein